MAIPTVPQAIIRGDISTYLSANYNSKGVLFGGRKAPISAVSIALVTDALRWGYQGGSQTDESLRSTANYLIWLCNMWGQEAEAISQGAGGGTVIPPGTTVPDPYDWVVSTTTSSTEPLKSGDTSVVISNLIGWNIDYFRGKVLQQTTDEGDGSTYYGWNKGTGTLTLFNGAAQLGEPMRISPIS